MKFHKTVILLILMAGFCCIPVLGVDKYVGGVPEITAYISGVNEFSPGQNARITVVLQNDGTYEEKFSNRGTLAADDAATTAKFVTVGLSSGTAPIVIKTDPQYLGNLPSPGTTNASFVAKITSDATRGEYTLPLDIQYTYLSNELFDQETSTSIQSHYTPVNLTIPLTIRIKPGVKIDVLDAVTSNLVVGTEGYVNLTIRNAGNENGKQATVKILRNGKSSVIPTDDSVYIGDFFRDGTISCLYKIAVSADAKQQTYPVDIVVTYTNAEGDIVTSTPETVGVSVTDKLGFIVISPAAVVMQGETRVITVEYKNQGTVTANKAQARLSPVDPLSGSDILAYLGDIPPGGNATAHFAITAATAAAPGTYALDTEVRYRDSLDNSQLSDTFKAPVTVAPRSGFAGLMPILTVLVVLTLIGAGYYVYVMKRKR